MIRRSEGVTLMELMITLAIVAILAAVAIPGYRQYSMRGHRTEGAMALTQMAARQEQFYLQNNSYANALGDLGFGAETEHGRYDLAITAGNATNFVVRATAKGGQAEDTDCKVLAIDEDGLRYGGPGPVGASINMGSHNEDCWRGR
ncbi:MAG: type IV pilin protein [Gammaproteobacteria bacterium]